VLRSNGSKFQHFRVSAGTARLAFAKLPLPGQPSLLYAWNNKRSKQLKYLSKRLSCSIKALM
jgi:hypothetical protein